MMRGLVEVGVIMVADFSDPVGPPDRIDVVDPDQDLDGNGVDDSVVIGPASPLAGLLHGFLGGDSTAVVSDFDGDGRADHITTFEDDGGYASWQLISGDDPTWDLTDRGSL